VGGGAAGRGVLAARRRSATTTHRVYGSIGLHLDYSPVPIGCRKDDRR
jgi:hypothetical protein